MTVKHRSRWFFAVASLLTAFGLAFAGLALLPVTAAHADEDDPPPGGQGQSRAPGQCLTRLQEWYGIQDGNLGRAADGLARVQTIIDKASEHGLDPSELEAALAEAQSRYATAQEQHANAARILEAHAGFGDDGSVVDRQAARQTCESARSALESARDALIQIRDIGREIRTIVQDWRDSRPITNREAF